MVRRAIRRFVSAAGVLAAAAALAVGVAPGAAHAAPKPAAKASAVSIDGSTIDDPIVIQQKEQGRLFTSLLNEVDWTATAKGQTSAPEASKLGQKFT
ncbi:MAG TPA: hypothetical protein VGB74_10505, partial [Actinoplanes sp.]